MCGGESWDLFLLGVVYFLAGVENCIWLILWLSWVDGFLGGLGYKLALSLVPPLFWAAKGGGCSEIFCRLVIFGVVGYIGGSSVGVLVGVGHV